MPRLRRHHLFPAALGILPEMRTPPHLHCSSTNEVQITWSSVALKFVHFSFMARKVTLWSQ